MDFLSIFAPQILIDMVYNEIGKTGMRVSNLGFGASSLGGVFHSIREEEGIQAVHMAVDNGINFIDVSPYYGHLKAESVLGKALKEIPREKYYLSTKVGRYGKDGVNTWDYSAKRATESVYESMERLNVDYIDLINVHDIEFQADLPGGLQKVVDETLPALVELRNKGIVKHVGITDLQVGVINASPFSMGLLSQRGAPAWHPAGKDLQKACAKAAAYCQEKGYPIDKLAIQFSTSLNPRIATTLFSSANPQNVLKNINYVNEPMDEQLVKEVQAIIGDQMFVRWKNS